MRIGWLGLGRLGMPCALALANAGHRVIGYDPSPHAAAAVRTCTWPHHEPGVEQLLAATPTFEVVPEVAKAVGRADVVFVAVQTPHPPGHDGSVPAPAALAPFDTMWLEQAVISAEIALSNAGNPAPLAIVSTVLPGTCARVVETLTDRPVIYNPAFVAMGTVLADLARPEFILAGVRDKADAEPLAEVYAHVDAPLLVTGVESAELAKMAYNTAIGVKIVLANALMELAGHVGADVDEVSDVLQAATDRVASGRYLRGGMGDGGLCHPRDQIAMAWLATEHGLAADPFGFVMRAREAQACDLAERVIEVADRSELPVVIVGRAYKPGVAIDDGSAALLVGHYIEQAGHAVAWLDPESGHPLDVDYPAVFLLAVPDRQPDAYPEGSWIVDPWGVVPAGDQVVRVGRAS